MADDKLKRLNTFFQSGADTLLAGQGDRLASALEAVPSSDSLIDRPSYAERYDRALERRRDARTSMESAAPAESLFGRLVGFGASPIPKALAIPAVAADVVSTFRRNLASPAVQPETESAAPFPASVGQEAPSKPVSAPILAPKASVPSPVEAKPAGPFPSISARSVPEDVLARTSPDQPLVQWRDTGGTTHLVNNPKYEKKETPKKAFVPPKVAVVQTLKKHGVDSEYALEQLEQNPQALGELLGDLVGAANGSETLSFVLPALGRGSNNEILNAVLVAQNTGRNPADALRDVLYDTPDPQAPNGVWPGVLSRAQGGDARMMSSIVRSFLDEARGKTPQAYRPVSVDGGWTGGGGLPVEQTKTWAYEPFEPDYGD